MKQALDNVSQENLNLVMKEMGIDPVVARAILREQIGGKYDICFQETRVTGIHFDKSITQGGKESPCLFNLIMRCVFRTMQENEKKKKPPDGDQGKRKRNWSRIEKSEPHGFC